MTKKHFEAIAKILRKYHDKDYQHTETINAVEAITTDLMGYFRGENHLFDDFKFLRACRGTRNI